MLGKGTFLFHMTAIQYEITHSTSNRLKNCPPNRKQQNTDLNAEPRGHFATVKCVRSVLVTNKTKDSVTQRCSSVTWWRGPERPEPEQRTIFHLY